MQEGITLRDLVNAIPLYAIKAGLLTIEKKGKKNAFSGGIVEIEEWPEFPVAPGASSCFSGRRKLKSPRRLSGN